uniref:Ferritin n=1 Tax=Otolemur garnettii TaxID=30611 RepID=H0XN42_OTOGA
MATASSQVLQNYHSYCEAGVNRLINLKLYTSYVYLSMAAYFDQDEVALNHFARYFLRQSHKEREQVEALMKLQNERGGRFCLREIKKPDERDAWESGLEAMEYALHLEKKTNQNLLNVHQLATDKGDAQLCKYLEKHYLQDQVKTIRELSGFLTDLRRLGAAGTRLADCVFDKVVLGGSDKGD